ncbi:putative phage protein (TIGR02218 family) [Orbus hercynius]|uniref:Putative phage protein (TIGR02218 family) n=1 Tax=Orbus hercynius TaxID=593135 RepID=A0A495RIA7_9GAMM|nr:phage BR0599 family protein [Orbus hercynius]RKS87141.1 putative phage protein (TIGR02218 family) [Orbus hercynius]
MNFNDVEKSLDGRQPIRLYEFSRGIFKYAYNSSAINITYNNQLFKALIGGISDSGIIRSDGGTSDSLTITCPPDIEVAKLFANVAPSKKVTLKIYNSHLGLSTAEPVWLGDVVSVNFAAFDMVKISAIPTESASNKLGATLTYSRQCNAVLYDQQCQVNKEHYKKTDTITRIDLTTIDVTEAANMPDGWFTGGFIEFSIGNGEYDMRAIETHIGTKLIILGGTAGLKHNMVINFYPGCDLAKPTCKTKFNNLLNMRATPYLKDSSPFDGNPVGW